MDSMGQDGETKLIAAVREEVRHAAADAATVAATAASTIAASAAVELAIAHHQNQCPMAALQVDHKRIMKDLYNGDDEPGFIADSREFFAEARTERRTRKDMEIAAEQRRKDGFKNRVAIWSLATTVLCVAMVWPVERAWKAGSALMDLAGRAPAIIKLTEDWQRYYAMPPTDPPVTIIPQDSQPKPVKPKHSYFQRPGGVSFNKQPAQDAGGFSADNLFQKESR